MQNEWHAVRGKTSVLATTFVATLCLTLLAMPVLLAQTSSGYHLSKKITIGGEGGWDYISCDPSAKRLYVSNSDRVVVVSSETGNVVGEIPKTEGVHGIAIADDLGKGFISDGRSSMVTVFNVQSLEIIGEVPSEKNPDAILYDTFTHRVFAFNGRSGSATVIDGRTDSVLSTIPLGGKPEFAVTDGEGRIFVNIEDKSEVAAIDPVKLTVTRRWSVAPGEEPSGLAIDAKNHRLFSVCGNKLMVVSDADSGKVVTTLPIGGRVDGCAFDPGTMLAFSSNGEGTMTVVREESPEKFIVVENVKTQLGARTMAVDPVTHAVYLPTAEFGPAPEPTADRPHPRPSIIPNSFVVLEFRP